MGEIFSTAKCNNTKAVQQLPNINQNNAFSAGEPKQNIWVKINDFATGAVQRANHFFTPERILFFALLLFAIHAVISLFFNTQIYRDVANVYAWYAREFSRGLWCAEPISKVPALNIFLAGLLAKCGIEAYRAMILLALGSMLLTLVPLYKLLTLFLSPRMAAWGCVLWLTAPKLMRFSGAGLLESSRDLFLVTACYLLFKSRRQPCKWHHWCLFGVSLGLLALARGEGIFMAGCMGAGLLIRPVSDWKSWNNLLQKILKPLLITTASALIMMSPVIVQNYKVTGYPVTDARLIGVVQLIPGIQNCFTEKKAAVVEPQKYLTHDKLTAPSRNETAERLSHLPKNALRGAYEIYFVLALLGIGILVLAKKWQQEYSFLIAYSLVVTGSFVFFSVAYRYFIFIIPLFMVFTMTGLAYLLELAQKFKLHNILIAGIAVLILLQPFNAWSWMLKKDGAEEKEVAGYIKKNRQMFLPAGEQRKLIVHGDMRVIYHCDESRVFHYGEYYPPLKYVIGFDVVVVRQKQSQDLADCMARQDLRQIETPLSAWAVFVPERKK